MKYQETKKFGTRNHKSFKKKLKQNKSEKVTNENDNETP